MNVVPNPEDRLYSEVKPDFETTGRFSRVTLAELCRPCIGDGTTQRGQVTELHFSDFIMRMKDPIAVGMGLAFLMVAGVSHGVTRLHTVDDIAYRTLAAQSRYASSGFISVAHVDASYSLGSGTLVASDWVLTVAHAVTTTTASGTTLLDPSQITFGQGGGRPVTVAGDIAVKKIVVAPGWRGDPADGNDLALLQLAEPITSVAPARLYDANVLGSELGHVGTLVGYSAASGTGLTGNRSAGSVRRAATNVIDSYGTASVVGYDAAGAPTTYHFTSGPNILLSDFDSPDNGTTVDNPIDPSNFYNIFGSGDPTAYEGIGVGGDSGGGLFVTIDGITYLAGVHSFGGYVFNSPFDRAGYRGYYGDFSGATRVSPHISFILNTITQVPEPGTGIAAISGAFLLLRRRR